MFSNKDFIEYFTQVKIMEYDMEKSFAEIVDNVSDEYLKNKILKLVKDEARHGQEIAKIEKMFSKSKES